MAVSAKAAYRIAQSVNSGEISIQDIANHYITCTEKYASLLNTHTFYDRNVVEETVSATSRYLESQWDQGVKPPLAGVPFLIKDNISTQGIPTTCASKILEGFRPLYDATVIKRIKKLGGFVLGKTNMDEFGMGSSTEFSAYGPCRNPWDKSRVSGGSSGGSASAVAMGMAPVSLGSDTGGSVRQPASFCGVIGLKPTYGNVSRYGLVAYGSSLDQIGPIATNVRDVALVFDAISGHDRFDSTSAPDNQSPIFPELNGLHSLKGMKIGFVKEFFPSELDSEVKTSVMEGLEEFKSQGAEIVELSFPWLKFATPTYYLIAMAEASANLSRFDGVRYGQRGSDESLERLYKKTRSLGFGREVKNRIMLGSYALSAGYYDAFYAKACKVRKHISNQMFNAFTKVNLIVSPTSPSTAFPIGEKVDDPIQMYLGDIYTISANLSGVPAISLPCGFDSKGLPIGLQLMANKFDEKTLLKGAFSYEQATEWHRQQPKPIE